MVREIELYGKRVAVAGGPLAVWAYWREFDSDLWADLRAANTDDGPILAVWLQVVWAMAKAADEATPEFGKWLGAFEEFDLGDVTAVAVMDQAFYAAFFRRRQASGAKRARRAIGRWLESLAQRLSGAADGDVAR